MGGVSPVRRDSLPFFFRESCFLPTCSLGPDLSRNSRTIQKSYILLYGKLSARMCPSRVIREIILAVNTNTKTNTFRQYFQRTILETCDHETFNHSHRETKPEQKKLK